MVVVMIWNKMDSKLKSEELKKIMGGNLARRFVIAKITHWDFDEFIPVRTESKIFWTEVLIYLDLLNYHNP